MFHDPSSQVTTFEFRSSGVRGLASRGLPNPWVLRAGVQVWQGLAMMTEFIGSPVPCGFLFMNAVYNAVGGRGRSTLVLARVSVHHPQMVHHKSIHMSNPTAFSLVAFHKAHCGISCFYQGLVQIRPIDLHMPCFRLPPSKPERARTPDVRRPP